MCFIKLYLIDYLLSIDICVYFSVYYDGPVVIVYTGMGLVYMSDYIEKQQSRKMYAVIIMNVYF